VKASRTCAWCSTPFRSHIPTAKYCTDRCRYKARSAQGTKPHYRGTYPTQARKVREMAYANPDTECGRCGLTLAQHKPGDTWTAGHLIDGQPGGQLQPETKSCNSGAGARMGNLTRRRTPLTW
jgi:hypothetical protein